MTALYGTNEPPSELTELNAGQLAVLLEGGNLRYIRFLGVEVLRGISFLIRDTRWGTYDVALSDVSKTQSKDAFQFSYTAMCSGSEGSFSYRAVIEGSAAGELSMNVCGSSTQDFPTNRTGFVVLHPIEGVAGSLVDIEHVDGRKEALVLPLEISPDQPAFDLRATTHETENLKVRVEMQGDAFEMEDQRNWTDASFKTYVRPLSKPRPFVIPAGSLIDQSIRVQISGEQNRKSETPKIAVLRVTGEQARPPKIGLGFESKDADETLKHAHLLKQMAAHAIIARHDFRCDNEAALTILNNVGQTLDADVTLEAIIPGLDAGVELGQLAAACRKTGLSPAAILASPVRDLKTRPSNSLPQGQSSAMEIAIAARAAFPQARIGGGMVTSFTEMNRNRPATGAIDFVSHSTCANTHAADDISVMETLEALDHVMRSTRKISGSIPYRIGPSAIGMRENPYGASVAENAGRSRSTMVRDDPRHRALFGAAWSLAYAAVAAKHGLEMVTLAHGVGDFGVINNDASIRPLFHVLRGLALAQSAALLTIETGSNAIAGLGFRRNTGSEFWLANKTPAHQTIDLQSSFNAALLTAENVKAAEHDPVFLFRNQFETRRLDMPAFAIAHVWAS